MQQNRKSEDVRDGGKGAQDDAVILTVACDGTCDRCPNASAKEVRVLAGGEKTVCRFGWKYLRTDAPPGGLYGVRKADALGDAAKAARANRAETPDTADPVEASEVRIIRAQAPIFGTLAGRRSGNMNSGQKERRFEMNVGTENTKDMQLLNLRGLTPLDTSAVAADGDFVAMVEVHNARLARAVDRLRQLAADRERLADFDAWLAAESSDIATARCHVRREAWDAILELRRVLEERETLLVEMEGRLRNRYCALDDAHSAAVAKAEKRLAKERPALEKANPYNAGSRFVELVANEAPVAGAAEALASAREAFESVAAARRAIGGDLTMVTTRQREVFAWLMA
jgi:hypothetical protein